MGNKKDFIRVKGISYAVRLGMLVLGMLYATFTLAQNTNTTETKKPVGLLSSDGKSNFAQANPEDITNENFPNLIESFDYPNAQLSEVVKAISKLTGKNFILEKNVGGTISIIAPSQITVAEAYNAFLTALAMNNLVVVPSGKF